MLLRGVAAFALYLTSAFFVSGESVTPTRRGRRIGIGKKSDYFEPLALVSGFLRIVTGEGSLDPTGPVNSSFEPSS